MIYSSGTPLALVPFALYGSQPSTYPSVQRWEDVSDAVLEVFHPPSDARVDLPDYRLHRVASFSGRFLSNGIFELIQALLAWPFHAPLKVVAQKVKASPLGSIDYVRLRRFDGRGIG